MTKGDKLLIIGTGNVAYNLANAFKSQGLVNIDLLGRSWDKTVAMASFFGLNALNGMKEIAHQTSLIFICVPDDKITEVIANLPFKEQTVVHTAGAVNLNVFADTGIFNYGVFYPLQSLSKNNLSNLQDVPICLEASNEKVLTKLKEAASFISKNVVVLDSEQRAVLHLAAVFANNFTNHLFALSEKLLTENQLSYELLKPLISQTAINACSHSPSAIQTGPAKRGDERTMNNHLELLNDPELKSLYQLMSRGIKKINRGN